MLELEPPHPEIPSGLAYTNNRKEQSGLILTGQKLEDGGLRSHLENCPNCPGSRLWICGSEISCPAAPELEEEADLL